MIVPSFSNNPRVVYATQSIFYSETISVLIDKFDIDLLSAECLNGIVNQSECALDGQIEVTSIILTTYSDALSFSYYPSIDFYDNKIEFTNYSITDVNSCIWTRPVIEESVCEFNLPKFILNSTYKIHIGTMFSNIRLTLTPFEQCQSSPFLTYIVDNSTNLIPNYITINNENQTVEIDLSKILMIKEVNLIFWAQLISFYLLESDLSLLTTKNSSCYIEFFNNNCDIKSTNITSYLVVNKTFNSTFEFTDIEADRVSLKYTYNNLVNIFIRPTSNIDLKFDIIMNTETASQTPTTLEFSYTDSYHQDNQYWTWLNVTVNLFASEPPIFDSSLANISISRCSFSNYLLPHVTEPDGQNFTIQLADSTPNWIELINNSTLKISPLEQQITQVETVQVEILLTDETNAFSKYAMNVTLQPYFSPQFGAIETINSSDLVNGVILNITSPNYINAVDCSSNSSLSWLHFNASSSVLMLKSQMPVGIICCRLCSVDTCGASICSNEFNITQKFNMFRPPAITNLFGPLTIYVYQEFEFEVPSDLFYSEDHSLMYSISAIDCNRNYPLKSNLSKYNRTGQLYLYLSCNFVQYCQLNLLATDKYDQHGSIIVEIIVNACASKDCLECTGPYQSDCTKCLYNYKLSNEGQCLQISAYYIENSNDFYSFCGIISMIVLIISIFMSPLLGRKYLYNISYAQTFLILIFCTSDVDQNIKVFTSWLQFSKLDFGYLFYSGFNSILGCTLDSAKIANLQFGCQSTVLNYFWVLVFFAFMIITYKILIAFKHKLELINLLANFINNTFPSSLIMWIFIHLYYQLELINIISLDIMMMRSHPLASGMSLIIAICMIIYFSFKHQLFSKSLLESIDAENGLSFALLSLIKYSFASSLFVSEDYVTQFVCAILHLCCCIIILYIQIKTDQTSLKIKALQRFNKIIKTSFNLMLSVVVFFFKLFMSGADQRLLVFIATCSFVLCLITELMSDITEIVASKFFK